MPDNETPSLEEIEAVLAEAGMLDGPPPLEGVDWSAALSAMQSGDASSPALDEIRKRLGPAAYLLEPTDPDGNPW